MRDLNVLKSKLERSMYTEAGWRSNVAMFILVIYYSRL